MPIICFFGTDGSGKSTLAKALTKRLDQNGFEVRLSWMRGTHTLASLLARLLSKSTAFKGSDNSYYKTMISSAHTKFALETALKLTHNITISAFGTSSPLVRKPRTLFRRIGMIDAVVSTNRSVDLPMRYTPHLLIRGLLEKILEDPASRGSLPSALKSAFNPRFFTKLSEHTTWKGY